MFVECTCTSPRPQTCWPATTPTDSRALELSSERRNLLNQQFEEKFQELNWDPTRTNNWKVNVTTLNFYPDSFRA